MGIEIKCARRSGSKNIINETFINIGLLLLLVNYSPITKAQQTSTAVWKFLDCNTDSLRLHYEETMDQKYLSFPSHLINWKIRKSAVDSIIHGISEKRIDTTLNSITISPRIFNADTFSLELLDHRMFLIDKKPMVIYLWGIVEEKGSSHDPEWHFFYCEKFGTLMLMRVNFADLPMCDCHCLTSVCYKPNGPNYEKELAQIRNKIIHKW